MSQVGVGLQDDGNGVVHRGDGPTLSRERDIEYRNNNLERTAPVGDAHDLCVGSLRRRTPHTQWTSDQP